MSTIPNCHVNKWSWIYGSMLWRNGNCTHPHVALRYDLPRHKTLVSSNTNFSHHPSSAHDWKQSYCANCQKRPPHTPNKTHWTTIPFCTRRRSRQRFPSDSLDTCRTSIKWHPHKNTICFQNQPSSTANALQITVSHDQLINTTSLGGVPKLQSNGR